MIIPSSIYINPPQILRSVFSRSIWETANDEILLTFDDGPLTGVTEKILKSLDDAGFKALFFVNGSADKSLMAEIHLAGHSLGNHYFLHKYYFGFNRNTIIDSLTRTNDILEDITDKKTAYFRPTFGRPFIGMGAITAQLGLTTVMWSLLTWDFKHENSVVQSIIERNLSSRSILVFHNNDSTDSKIQNLLRVTFHLIEKRGLRIGGPAECLKS